MQFKIFFLAFFAVISELSALPTRAAESDLQPRAIPGAKAGMGASGGLDLGVIDAGFGSDANAAFSAPTISTAGANAAGAGSGNFGPASTGFAAAGAGGLRTRQIASAHAASTVANGLNLGAIVANLGLGATGSTHASATPTAGAHAAAAGSGIVGPATVKIGGVGLAGLRTRQAAQVEVGTAATSGLDIAAITGNIDLGVVSFGAPSISTAGANAAAAGSGNVGPVTIAAGGVGGGGLRTRQIPAAHLATSNAGGLDLGAIVASAGLVAGASSGASSIPGAGAHAGAAGSGNFGPAAVTFGGAGGGIVRA